MGGFIQKLVISEGKIGIAPSLHLKSFKIARYLFRILNTNLAQFRFSVLAILYRTQVTINIQDLFVNFDTERLIDFSFG